MRAGLLLAGFTIVGAIVALTAGSKSASAYGGACLRFRDLTGLTRVDDDTAIASTRQSSIKYKVVFRGGCRDLKNPRNLYSVRLYNSWECFDGDDVLAFRHGGLCFVQSVTRLPPAN